MLKHIGYLHGVTDQPVQCPSHCHPDEYRYYYNLGRRILRGTGSSFLKNSEPGQPERRIAA